MTDLEWITVTSTEPGHHATAVGDRFKTPSGAEYKIIATPVSGDYWTVEKTWLGNPTTFTVAAYSRNSRRYAKAFSPQKQESSGEWVDSNQPEPGNNCTEPGDQWRAITGNVYTVVRQVTGRTWQVQRPGMDPITRGLGTVSARAHRKAGNVPPSPPRPPVVREVTCSSCGRPLGEWSDGLIATKLGDCCRDVPREWSFDDNSGTFTRRDS